MPRALLNEALEGHHASGSGTGTKSDLQDELSAKLFRSGRRSYPNSFCSANDELSSGRSYGGADVLRPMFRGRGLRASYGDFFGPIDAGPPGTGPEDLPSGFSSSSQARMPDFEAMQAEGDGARHPLEQADAEDAALAKGVMNANEDQVLDGPGPGPGFNAAGPPGPGLGPGPDLDATPDEDVQYWVMEGSGDGKGPVLVRHEHHVSHGMGHVGHIDHISRQSHEESSVHRHLGNEPHHISVQHHVITHTVQSHPSHPSHPSNPPPQEPEPPPEPKQDPELLIEKPEVEPLQAKVVLGGALAIFAQVYLWGNVFVTLFKPVPRTSAQQGIAADAPPASPRAGQSEPPPALGPGPALVPFGAGGSLQGQAVAVPSGVNG